MGSNFVDWRNVMYSPWGTKRSHRSKPRIPKPKVHWDVLGPQDPAETSSTPSIDDIRRQIISASGAGLSPETLARAQTKGASRHSGPQAAVPTRKRGTSIVVMASRSVSEGGHYRRTRKNHQRQTRSRTRPATDAAREEARRAQRLSNKRTRGPEVRRRRP